MIIDIYEYFKKHPGYNKLVGSNFLLVEYKCPVNVEEFQLWTESHLITYVINGRKDWITPDKIYKLIAGNAIFIRKGVYTTRQHLEEDYCVMLFFINDDFIKNFILENALFQNNTGDNNDQRTIFEIDANDSFKSSIESIFHYLKESEKIPQRLIEIKFNELLFNIVLNSKNKELLNYFNTINQTMKVNIENIMTKNFQYNLKMEDFARLCGRSISAFKRDFKNNFKTTPYKWLTTKRLEFAKTLLLTTELSITEICYESGFQNNSHFIQAFKNKYALPPNKYKSENQIK